MASDEPIVHLIDNDFLIKLARWDLLDDYLTAYDIDIANVRAILTLRRRLFYSPGKPNLNLCGTAVAASRLHAFLTNVKPPIPTDPGFSQLATGTLDFEAGEVTLVSALCAGAGKYFYTGDKRAIRALLNFSATEFDAKFRGRVRCLEQALLAMIAKHGYGYISNKIAADRDADTGIANLFVGGAQTPQATACSSLNKCVADLQASCGGLLSV